MRIFPTKRGLEAPRHRAGNPGWRSSLAANRRRWPGGVGAINCKRASNCDPAPPVTRRRLADLKPPEPIPAGPKRRRDTSTSLRAAFGRVRPKSMCKFLMLRRRFGQKIHSGARRESKTEPPAADRTRRHWPRVLDKVPRHLEAGIGRRGGLQPSTLPWPTSHVSTSPELLDDTIDTRAASRLSQRRRGPPPGGSRSVLTRRRQSGCSGSGLGIRAAAAWHGMHDAEPTLVSMLGRHWRCA